MIRERLEEVVRSRDLVTPPKPETKIEDPDTKPEAEPFLEAVGLSVYYGAFRALKDVNLTGARHADLGHHRPFRLWQEHSDPLLQPHERRHRRLPAGGPDPLPGRDIYARNIDAVDVRRRIGMVFQKPNPFPKSIYENVAFGARINGYKGKLEEIVERALKQAALWDEVKDKLAERSRPLRRPAAAPLHRPRSRGRAGRHPHGRALLARWTRSPR